MKTIKLIWAGLLLIFLADSCAPIVYTQRVPPPHSRGRGRGNAWGNQKAYPFHQLGIPRGHLPPPGMCRIWLLGRPPGQQPRVQSCGSALRNAPLGAWVISNDGPRFRVSIFSGTRRGLISEVRFYLAK